MEIRDVKETWDPSKALLVIMKEEAKDRGGLC